MLITLSNINMKKILLAIVLLITPNVCKSGDFGPMTVYGQVQATGFIDMNASPITNPTFYNSTGTWIAQQYFMQNTGIGTSTPLADLHVFSPAGSTGLQMLVSTGTTNLFEVNGSSVVMNVSTVSINDGGLNTKWVNQDFAIYRDTKTAGTHGGTATSGIWNVRALTDTQIQVGSSISRPHSSSSTFTLVPGIYEIDAKSPIFNVGGHQARIYNLSTSTEALSGTDETAAASTVQTSSFITGIIIATGTFNYQIEHKVQSTNASTGLGQATTYAQKAVFTILKIRRIQ